VILRNIRIKEIIFETLTQSDTSVPYGCCIHIVLVSSDVRQKEVHNEAEQERFQIRKTIKQHK